MTDPPEDEPPALDDVLDRDDDFKEREWRAGGPAGVIGKLQAGLSRQVHIVRAIAVLLFFDITLSVVLAIGLNYLHDTKANVSANASEVHALRVVDWNACDQANRSAELFNAQHQSLVAYLKASGPVSADVTVLAHFLETERLPIRACGPRP